MALAFVLGNGRSRSGIDLDGLRQHGTVYGCNALYREWKPDVLIAADREISEHIQHSGYAQNNCFYTRRPLAGLGARRIPEQYWGFSSGQIALGLAAINRHTPVYFLGFDLGGINGHFNNVYADTEFYKRSSARPTYAGNWIRQIISVANDFPHTQFVRVIGTESSPIEEFKSINNINVMNLDQFCCHFGV